MSTNQSNTASAQFQAFLQQITQFGSRDGVRTLEESLQEYLEICQGSAPEGFPVEQLQLELDSSLSVGIEIMDDSNLNGTVDHESIGSPSGDMAPPLGELNDDEIVDRGSSADQVRQEHHCESLGDCSLAEPDAFPQVPSEEDFEALLDMDGPAQHFHSSDIPANPKPPTQATASCRSPSHDL